MARVCFAALLALLVAFPRPSSAGGTVYDSRSAFDALKQLTGEWDAVGDEPKYKYSKTRYRVTAGGTVVEEVAFLGQPTEMTTMFYLEKGALVLHHYCLLGNQPEMKFEAAPDAGVLQFTFRDTGAINLRRDDHMHSVTYRIEGPNKMIATWQRYGGGVRQKDVTFIMTRVKK